MRSRTKTNPWGLSPMQCSALAAVATAAVQKIAARELGISNRTLEVHLHGARSRMGVHHTLHAVLAWDRFARVKP
jgi:FixJ family two-component response regulator